MTGKITLITPPDIFENNNKSIFLGHISDDEQNTVSVWLKEQDFQEDLNIYLYSGEHNINWLFYALSCCEHKYINIDCVNYITQSLSSYILSKNDVYYKTTDTTLGEIYRHINTKRVDNIELFLESIISGQTTNTKS